jgi:hypothetical protein
VLSVAPSMSASGAELSPRCNSLGSLGALIATGDIPAGSLTSRREELDYDMEPGGSARPIFTIFTPRRPYAATHHLATLRTPPGTNCFWRGPVGQQQKSAQPWLSGMKAEIGLHAESRLAPRID